MKSYLLVLIILRLCFLYLRQRYLMSQYIKLSVVSKDLALKYLVPSVTKCLVTVSAPVITLVFS